MKKILMMLAAVAVIATACGAGSYERTFLETDDFRH